VGCGRFYGKNLAERRQPSLRKEGSMAALIPGPHHDHRMTRRSIFVGAAASLICAPAIVRAASLMPIRCVIVATNPINPKKPINSGFAGALRLHWMKQALKRGWDERHDGPTFGGISETEARNYVAFVRTQGSLPPRGSIISDLTKAGSSRRPTLAPTRNRPSHDVSRVHECYDLT
jgi:hypothetical protein